MVKIAISLHGIRCPKEVESHSKTVGRLVVGVDVVPVVDVVEVVVAAGEKPENRSRFTYETSTAASLFRLLRSVLCVAAVFYVRQKAGAMKWRVAPRCPLGQEKI